MSSAILSSLTVDDIDDLLYLARLGETTELKAAIDLSAKTLSTTPHTILAAAVDKESSNGLLHMAAANGHVGLFSWTFRVLCCYTTNNDLDTLKQLLTLSASSQATLLNLQNASGNTPLHWAALNGHLPAVKLLIGAGADPSVMNRAGKDAVYEAEVNEKNEVAAWLLTEGKSLESAVGVDLDQPAPGVQEEADAEEHFEEETKKEDMEE